MSVLFLQKSYIHHCYHGVIIFWKNLNIKALTRKTEGLVKWTITYLRHIQIMSCHMVIICLVPDDTVHLSSRSLGRLKTRHYAYENSKQGDEQWPRRKTLHLCFEASRESFQINAEPLPLSEAFSYLGMAIAFNNRDWPVAFQNLNKARRWWGMISRVFLKTGPTVWFPWGDV